MKDKQPLIESCLRYMNATKLPMPLPMNAAEYAAWREKAAVVPTVERDDEDAWFELTASSLSTESCLELVNRTHCTMPRTTVRSDRRRTIDDVLRMHRDEFSSKIDEELTRNEGFRTAYHWLQ